MCIEVGDNQKGLRHGVPYFLHKDFLKEAFSISSCRFFFLCFFINQGGGEEIIQLVLLMHSGISSNFFEG